jgi:hypothetical protein
MSIRQSGLCQFAALIHRLLAETGESAPNAEA